MNKEIKDLRKKFKKYDIDGYVFLKMMIISQNIQKLID